MGDDAFSTDARYDISHIVGIATASLSSQGAPVLRDVQFKFSQPLQSSPLALSSKHTSLLLHPGEYLTSASGRRTLSRVCSLTFTTSLGRHLAVGTGPSDRGAVFYFSQRLGQELRSLTVMRDSSQRKILSVQPHFTPRKRVRSDYHGVWLKVLDKIRKKAAKYTELPGAKTMAFIETARDTIDRLVSLDDRGVVSPAAIAASFDQLLKEALQDAFKRPHVFKRAFQRQAGVPQRVETLTKLSTALQKLVKQLADRWEETERAFLTIPAFSDGTDVLHFVLQFAAQPISIYNCTTAVAMFTSHVGTMTGPGWDYASRLIHFFLTTGDLAQLKVVVRVQAAHLHQTKAEVLEAWAHCVPAVRLAIKHRTLKVLQWLLLDVRLSPNDSSPCVQLDADSTDRLWTMDQLLVTRDDDDETVCEQMRRLVTQVRHARAFHEQTQALLSRCPHAPILASDLIGLVPLVTHAFDLKWLFTLLELCRFPLCQRNIHSLFAAAFDHVLDHKLVLDEPSAIFFRKAFKEACRRRYISEETENRLEVRFPRVHVQGADWVIALQHDVRRTMAEMETVQSRLTTLHDAFNRLRESLAHQAQAERDRILRKQLLSLVSMLLPMVAPAFALLEQTLMLCDPLAFVVAIIDDSITEGSNSMSIDQLLLGDEIAAGFPLQEGLSEALAEIQVDPQELVEILRDAVREDARDDGQLPVAPPAAVSTPRPLRFREAVQLLVEQRRELEEAARESVSDDFTRVSRMSVEFPRTSDHAPPAWQWYNVLANISLDYFRGE